MVRMWLISTALVLAGCSAGSNDPASTGEGSNADEPPFYRTDKNAKGPLTMSELQVSIPQELDAMYTENTRACFLATVEDLAGSAGDPETLDPSTVTFLPKDGSWQKLRKSQKRNSLAQSIISEAGVLCT